MNDFKFWNGGCTEDEFYAELKDAAWNILHENPGTDFGDWQIMLIEQYPTEVVDALGTNLLKSLRNFPTGGTAWTTTME